MCSRPRRGREQQEKFLNLGTQNRIGDLQLGVRNFGVRRSRTIPCRRGRPMCRPGRVIAEGRGRTHRSAPTGSCLPFRFVLLPPRRERRVFRGEGGGDNWFRIGNIVLFHKGRNTTSRLCYVVQFHDNRIIVSHCFPSYLKIVSFAVTSRLPLCTESSCPIRYRIFFLFCSILALLNTIGLESSSYPMIF